MEPLLAGRYRLEQSIGQGGMKEVWRAVDVRDGTAVAVAVLFRHEARLFANELELARRVTSPHVARVLDGGVTQGGGSKTSGKATELDRQAYIVSELCQGPDLRQYMRQHPGLPWQDKVVLARQFAIGLRAVHEAHVLHRDVKPDNAIVTPGGIKVIDFGISEPAVDNTTDVGSIVAVAGTLAYMAPEVIRNERIDARSDVYAFGITLFELLSGQVPVKENTPMEMIYRVLQTERHDTRPLGDLPPALVSLVADMIAMNHEERPYMPAVVDCLGEILAGITRPAAASPGGPQPHRAPVGPETQTLLSPPPMQPSPGRGVTQVDPVRPESSGETNPAPVQRRSHIALDVAISPEQVIPSTWPGTPLVVLLPGRGTRITAMGSDGQARWSRSVARHLHGGMVADLDGDGARELHVWSRDAVLSFDAHGELRFESSLPWNPGAEPGGLRGWRAGLPWEQGPPDPVALSGWTGAGELLAAGYLLDSSGAITGELGTRYEGNGNELVDARGTRGFSCYGAARQAFRGDCATPAALLVVPGDPGFHVAHLERVLGDGPVIRVSVYGPGGGLISQMKVGTYDFKTAPIFMMMKANSEEHGLFDMTCAPLAVARPDGFTIIAPYLVNAPWFGPVVVAFDADTGAELWRTRLPAVIDPGGVFPPILGSITGDGGIELLFRHNGAVQRTDVATGSQLPSLPITGVPVALGDFESRGRSDLVVVGDRCIELWDAGPCTPGAITWVGFRGDHWRSGCLGARGHAIGPRG